jgi:hypothetical protein
MKRSLIFTIIILAILIIFGGIGDYYLTSTGQKYASSLPIKEGQSITDRQLDTLYTNLTPEQYSQNPQVSKDRALVANTSNMLNPFSPVFTYVYDASKLEDTNSVSLTKLDLTFSPQKRWQVSNKHEYQLFGKTFDEAKELAKGDFWRLNKEHIVDLSSINTLLVQLEKEKSQLDSKNTLYEIKSAMTQLNFNIKLLELDKDSYGSKTPDYAQIQKDIQNRLPIDKEFLQRFSDTQKDIELAQNTSQDPQKEILVKEWVQKIVFNFSDEYFQKSSQFQDSNNTSDAYKKYLESADQRKQAVTQNTNRIDEIKQTLSKK